jgi:hypothetical protein
MMAILTGVRWNLSVVLISRANFYLKPLTRVLQWLMTIPQDAGLNHVLLNK